MGEKSPTLRKFVKFPFKKLTRVKVGSQPGWTDDTTVKVEFPTYRYLWYEMCSAPGRPNECYMIVINGNSKPFTGGVWSNEHRRYDMLVYGSHQPFFKLSLLAQLHILQQLPDTRGELGMTTQEAWVLLASKLREALK